MFGHTFYLDEERRHGIKLKGINFNLITKYHQDYFDKSTRNDVLDGKLELEIVRNVKIQDYEILGEPNTLPYYENKEVSVLYLPKEIQNRMIKLWEDIEKELTKTKPLFKDAGK